MNHLQTQSSRASPGPAQPCCSPAGNASYLFTNCWWWRWGPQKYNTLEVFQGLFHLHHGRCLRAYGDLRSAGYSFNDLHTADPQKGTWIKEEKPPRGQGKVYLGQKKKKKKIPSLRLTQISALLTDLCCTAQVREDYRLTQTWELGSPLLFKEHKVSIKFYLHIQRLPEQTFSHLCHLNKCSIC